MPLAASRKLIGTDLKASSDDTTMIGRTMSARVKLPASRLGPNSNILTKIANPTRPNTIDGTPARFWIRFRRKRVYLVSGAISLK